ncbi:MAG: hypothetical protein PHS86_10725 [Syntrophaceae bacterium]|nr:hypothetical protein [Syntrophaceae bacterium]
MTDYLVVQGSLVVVCRKGVLITGKPGCGKSMAIINLALTGSEVVCDELVKIHRSKDNVIIGEPVKSPAMIEVRGLGIFRLDDLFPGAIRQSSVIDFAVELDTYDASRDLGRTEADFFQTDFLGVMIPHFRAPVAHGVNTHVLIEVIARAYSQNGLKQN